MTEVRRFIDAHRNDDLSSRGVRLLGDHLMDEVLDAEVYLNLLQENPGRAYRIGVLFGALRGGGVSLDTLMAILGDTDG